MILQILQDPGTVIDRDTDRLHDSFLQHPVPVQYTQHALSAENNLGLRKGQLSLFRPGFMASGPDTDQPEVLPAFPDAIFIRLGNASARQGMLFLFSCSLCRIAGHVLIFPTGRKERIRLPCHAVRIPEFPVFTHPCIAQSGLQYLFQRHGYIGSSRPDHHSPDPALLCCLQLFLITADPAAVLGQKPGRAGMEDRGDVHLTVKRTLHGNDLVTFEAGAGTGLETLL